MKIPEQLTDTLKGTDRTAGENYFAWSHEYQQKPEYLRCIIIFLSSPYDALLVFSSNCV